MSLASCPKCKKLFPKVIKNICPVCEAEEEDQFETVRAFISRTPGMNAKQVSEETGVSLETVMRFIEEGRVDAEGIASDATCGRCGKPAISRAKRLCQSCLGKLDAQIAQQQARIHLPEKKKVDAGSALNTFGVPVSGK